MTSDIAAGLAEDIKNVARKAVTEEDLKFGVQKLLDNALEKLGIRPEVQFEKRVYKSRRADVIYPDVVLEYKRPYALDNKTVVDTATDELSDYLKGLARSDKTSRKRVGVAIDGNKIMFVRARLPSEQTSVRSRRGQMTLDGRILLETADVEVTGPTVINSSSAEQLLIFLRQLERRVLSPENLAHDFGSKSDRGRKAVYLFYVKITNSKNPRVLALFNEWNRVFGIVYGESLQRAREEVNELAEYYGIKEWDVDLKRLLFSIHTYFALLMKMIASEVLAMQHEGLLASFAKNWALLEDSRLKSDFVSLESGKLFRKFGISNFLEGVFFSWYLDEWNENAENDIASIIRDISRKLSDYEPATTRIEPDEAKDLLKKLYQYLVPKTIRHDLGEYYTPDWLADMLLFEVGYEGNPLKRFLDPACGSGTFLTLALRKIIKKIKESPEKYDETILATLLHNVVGFDINPIAVLSSRTNYLIAIAPLRRFGGTEIEIPVYLADSVLTPRSYATALGTSYLVKTTVSEFRLHRMISNKETIGKILDTIDDVLSYEGSLEVFLKRLSGIISPELFEISKDDLSDLFSKLDRLRKEGRNHIWTSIIKNNFAPVYAGQFDYVVGNPPWIHWEDLAEEYRNATKEIWHMYDLLPRKTGKGFLAESSADLSMLFTYVSTDHYLKDTGKLGFLLTQTLFKAELRGRGFRRFRIRENQENQVNLKVESVHDFTNMQPFEGATNKTSFLVLKKGALTTYPVKYVVWNLHGNIEPNMALSEAIASLSRKELEAYPSQSDVLSPWVTVSKGGISSLNKVFGRSDYSAMVGTHTLGSNAIFWIKPLSKEKNQVLFENLPERAKKKVDKIKDVVEVDSIYPLLRGGDIKGRWQTNVQYSIIIPHSRKTGWRAIPQEELQATYPKTYSYVKQFEGFLKERVTYKKRRSGHPFYILFEIYPDSFMPYKVVWQRMTNELKAVVTEPITDTIHTNRPIMPSDTVTFVGFDSAQEAHYLCAMLNSEIVRKAVSSYSSAGRGFGAPHILEHIRIPKYDSRNKAHVELVKLSRLAHKNANNEQKVGKIEHDINRIASMLYQKGFKAKEKRKAGSLVDSTLDL